MKKPALSNSRRFGLIAGLIGSALFMLLAGAADTLAQCALCRDAVAAAPSQTREAMNYAILGLAFAPYVVAAFAVWMLFPKLRAQLRTGFRHLVPRGQVKPS